MPSPGKPAPVDYAECSRRAALCGKFIECLDDLQPPQFRALLKRCARIKCIDPEVIAGPLKTVLTTFLSPDFRVVIRPQTGHAVPGILWHIHVGESGSGKSSAHALLTKAVEDAQATIDLYLVAMGGAQYPRLQLLRLGVCSWHCESHVELQCVRSSDSACKIGLSLTRAVCCAENPRAPSQAAREGYGGRPRR